MDVRTSSSLFGGTVNALNLAAAADGSSNSTIKWFQYAGDTYVVEHNATAGFATGDVVVKLTGLHDLSTATLSTVSLTLCLGA